MKRFKYLFLFFILLLSFVLGARMILSGDFFYLFDQARDYLLIQDIVETRNLVLIGTHSGLGGFFHGPLWLYMLAPVYMFGGGNPFSFVYFYIGLQLVTVLVAFLVGSKLYGEKGGLIISVLVAISPITWNTVSNTIGVNVVPLVFLGLFYFLIKFLRGGANAYILAAFFAGLSLQFETVLSLVLIPTMIIVFFLNRKGLKNLRLIVLSLTSYILSLCTFILFDLRHKFLMTTSILNSFTGGQKQKGYLELTDRIPAHFNSLLGTYKSILFKETPLMSILLAAIFIFAVFLILKAKKDNQLKERRKEFLFLLLFPVLIFVFFVFYSYPIWPEYVLGLLVPVVLAFYLAIITVWKNFFGKILVILFFAITFLNVSVFVQSQYFRAYTRNNSSGSYLNQKAVADWVYKDARKGRFGYFVYTPETYTHGMDYLLSWYGKNNPAIIFENKKDTITYLILYPHMTNDEGAYNFWKKNTLRTNGKVILTKTFFGGITVKKLLIEGKEPEVDPNYYQGLIFR
ncbi:MAG: hypothetical protein COY68_03595 [Candidatus Levybacteria bacterium CG_4_10_14_0_8_um_filter_35_23]|nr:MAG: hypothetical protein COY68_03595 [Candidatus Levybacteria bacterium CG_4_10_14_0_8_um_filter_35_23]